MFGKKQTKSEILFGVWQTNCRPKVSKICPQCRTDDDVSLKTYLLYGKIDFLRQYLTVCHHFLDESLSGDSFSVAVQN